MTEIATKSFVRAQASQEIASKYALLEDAEVVALVLAEHKPSANAFIRGVWITVGSLFVAFAGIGIFLPGMPTTSWLVAAAYCYGRSSQKLFKWLITNRYLGVLCLDITGLGRPFPFIQKL